MEKNIFDTAMPENFSKTLLEEFKFNVPYQVTDMIADVTFSATAEILNNMKSKEHPVAFKIEKLNKTFVAAAIVQYFENEDKSNPGNWSLVFTFNEEDIPENASVVSILDPQVHSYFRAIAIEKHNFQYDVTDAIVILSATFLANVYKWLDENASATEEVAIGHEGIFQARVAIEGGEKVFALEPDGEIKVLIKDDESLQK